MSDTLLATQRDLYDIAERLTQISVVLGQQEKRLAAVEYLLSPATRLNRLGRLKLDGLRTGLQDIDASRGLFKILDILERSALDLVHLGGPLEPDGKDYSHEPNGDDYDDLWNGLIAELRDYIETVKRARDRA